MLHAMRGMRSLGAGNDFSAIPAFLTEMARRYGGIVHWRILGLHFYFVDDPALIEEALVVRGRDYKKGRGVQRLKRLVGNGLLTSEEPLHLRRRRLLQPAFHRERIDGYGRQMVAATLEHIAAWRPQTVLAVDAEMTRLTLTIAAQTLFSTNVVAGQADAIGAALTTVMRAFPASMSRLSELLEVLPLPANRELERARAQLDAVIYGLIAGRRNAPRNDHDDLLGMLLAAHDDAGGLDDLAIRDEAMTLFLAGHETTANALAWTLYLLARHPAVAERLAHELAAVLGDRAPTPADLPQLRYTRDVFAEAMRLYPPAWVLGRRALRDTVLGGFAIPRGAIVLACQLVTQRNARYWPDPLAFEPERWNADPAPPRFAFFPFGGGGRRCIGEAFAWMEGTLVLATIARRFRFEVVDPAPVDVQPLVTLRPRTAIRLRLGSTVDAAKEPTGAG
jgi:cytochrome P450